MMSHSISMTGWTESREFVTSTILAERGLALRASSVTGLFQCPDRTNIDHAELAG
jgi:hypothetical protein